MILLILLAIGAALYIYMNRILLPIQARQFLLNKAQEVLHRPVSFKDVRYEPLKGLVIENLVIYERQDPTVPFLKIPQASVNILLPPLILNKQVIISQLTIQDPFINIIREAPALWNFSDLLPQSQKPQEGKSKFQVLTARILINNASIQWTDRTFDPPFKESFERTHLEGHLSLKKGVQFLLETFFSQQTSHIKIEGNYDFWNKKVDSKVLLNDIPIGQYLSRYYPSVSVQFKSGFLKTADLSVAYEKSDISIGGQLTLNDIALTTAAGLKIQGNFMADSLSLKGRPLDFKLTGDLRFHQALITGIRDILIKGDLSLIDTDLKWIGAQAHLAGSLSFQNAFLQWAKGKIFEGNITGNGLQIQFGLLDQKLSVQGSIGMDPMALSIEPQLSLSGKVQARDLLFSYFQNKGNLKTHLDVQEAQLRFGEDRHPISQLENNPPLESSMNEFSHPGGEELPVEPQFAFQIGVEKTSLIRGWSQQISGDLSADIRQFEFQEQDWHLNGTLQLQKARAAYGNTLFIGDPSGSLDIRYHKQKGMDYLILCDLPPSQFKGLPYLKTIESLQGKIRISPQVISFETLDLNADQMSFHLSGQIKDFLQPNLDVQVSSPAVDIEKILGYLPPQISKKIPVQMKGQAASSLTYKGPLKEPLTADIILEADLKEAWVKSHLFSPEISQINGKLRYDRGTLTLKDIRGVFLDRELTLNGRLQNPLQPKIEASLRSEKISLTSQVELLNKTWQIHLLKGKYLNSEFDAKGIINIQDPAHPEFDVKGTLQLQLADLKDLLPPLYQNPLKFLEPAGVLNIQGQFQGDPLTWEKGSGDIKAASPQISLHQLAFTETTIQCHLGNEMLSPCNLNALVYEGALRANLSADLSQEEMPIQFGTTLHHLNLARLRDELSLQDRFFSGDVSAFLNIRGPITNTKAMKGEGSLSIINGHIWHFKLLRGLLEALLIPGMKDIVFTDALVTVAIEDHRALIPNFEIKGSQLSLIGDGWIDIDKNIEFDIAPKLNEFPLIKAIQVTGTIDKPQIRIIKSPIDIIEKTTDFLRDGVQTILDEIF